MESEQSTESASTASLPGFDIEEFRRAVKAVKDGFLYNASLNAMRALDEMQSLNEAEKKLKELRYNNMLETTQKLKVTEPPREKIPSTSKLNARRKKRRKQHAELRRAREAQNLVFKS